MGCKGNGIMVVMTALLGFAGMEGVTLQPNAQQGPGSSIVVNWTCPPKTVPLGIREH